MSTSRDHPPPLHNGRRTYELRPQFQEYHHHHDDSSNGGGHHHRRDGVVRQQRQVRYNDDYRSGIVQWTAAVVLTVLAVVVLLAAVAVLVVVLLLQPRSPYLAVRSASLDALVYDQTGALDDVQLSLLVEARNGNAHSAAGFSRLELRLSFGGGGGAVLAKLRADPFQLPPKGTLPLAYVARSQGVPLDATRSAAVEAALRDGVVPFRVDGEAKTAWKIAGLVAIHHWTRLGCELRFFWPNGSALHFSCSSKSKFLF